MADAEGAARGEVTGDFLPQELSDVTPLTDEEVEKIGERLHKLAEGNDSEGLDRLIASLLWEEACREQRQGLMFRALMGFLVEEISRENIEVKDLIGSFSRHALFAMWRISLSPDMDRVRAHRGKAGAPCVLILGFAGSSVGEIRPQEDFYRSLGYSAISLTMCVYPRRMRQRQLARVAWALAEFLDPECPRLMLHCCSGHGMSLMDSLCFIWLAGQPPFDKLPDLKSCLCAFVFECIAPSPALEGGYMCRDIPKDLQDWADQLSEEASMGDDYVFFGAANNTLEDMSTKYTPESRWFSVAGHNKDLTLLLRSINPKYEKFENGNHGAQLPWWNDYCSWTALESEMASSKTNVPRLFLFSKGDKLFTEAAVEHSIDLQWALLPRQSSKILVEKCVKSKHCKLWVTEKSICEKAVQKLLKVAKLKKM